MAYHTPTTLAQALAALAAGARPVAGGTDFFPALGPGLPEGDLVDLTGVGALGGIAPAAGGWRIGATVTWSQIARAGLPPAFAALQQAARAVGALQIQNAGTIGGNLANASPAADGVPPLLLLEAAVELAGPQGSRRLPLGDFLRGPRQTALAPGEILTAIHLPAPPEAPSVFEKLGSRKHLVISYVMVAALLQVEAGVIRAARVAVGACSPVARRLPALEAALQGQPFAALADPALVTPAHLAPLAPIDDIRADATYRREAAGVLVGRALARLGALHAGPLHV